MPYPSNLSMLTATHKVVTASGQPLRGNVYAVPAERVWATDGSIVEYDAKAPVAADGSYELPLPHIDQANIQNKGVPWKITEEVPGSPRSFWVAPMVAHGTGRVDVSEMLTTEPSSRETVVHAGPVTDAAAAELLDQGGQFATRLSTTIATEVDAAIEPTILLDADGVPYFVPDRRGIAFDVDGRPYVTIGA